MPGRQPSRTSSTGSSESSTYLSDCSTRTATAWPNPVTPNGERSTGTLISQTIRSFCDPSAECRSSGRASGATGSRICLSEDLVRDRWEEIADASPGSFLELRAFVHFLSRPSNAPLADRWAAIPDPAGSDWRDAMADHARRSGRR